MEKYTLLLSYMNKQLQIIEKLHGETIGADLALYDKRFFFALRVQQLYTAIEDLFKQIAKAFENHIESMSHFHKEILARMNLEIAKMRPAVISKESLLFLDKVLGFRHFIRHAYDCELDEEQLMILQNRIRKEFSLLLQELMQFRDFVQKLA